MGEVGSASPSRPETLSFKQNLAQAPISVTTPITRAADVGVNPIQPPNARTLRATVPVNRTGNFRITGDYNEDRSIAGVGWLNLMPSPMTYHHDGLV